MVWFSEENRILGELKERNLLYLQLFPLELLLGILSGQPISKQSPGRGK